MTSINPSAPDTTRAPHKKPSSRRRTLRLLLFVLFVALVGVAFFAGRETVYRAYPGIIDIEKATKILDQVGKLIELPAGEVPQMTVITDVKNLRGTQPFFAKARNDDVVIVYGKSQVAILYRPAENKLITVAPLILDNPTATSTPAMPATSAGDSTTNEVEALSDTPAEAATEGRTEVGTSSNTVLDAGESQPETGETASSTE